MVHTLVSPMSTCQRAPDDAPKTLPAELAEVECLRGLDEAPLFDKPPALEEYFDFLTLPPSLDGNSKVFRTGDAGSLRSAAAGLDPK